MLIQRKQTGNKGMFYVEEEGQVEAEMTYHMVAPNKMVIEHTEVEDDLRGQNVGYQLVQAGVESRPAQHQDHSLVPVCKKSF